MGRRNTPINKERGKRLKERKEANIMSKMRTIDEAAAWLKETDPGSSLTKTALRRLVITGAIHSVKIGKKYLLCLENLDQYLRGEIENR